MRLRNATTRLSSNSGSDANDDTIPAAAPVEMGDADPAAAPIDLVDDGYRPGVCNIGPEEVARRRRSGHIALGATAALLAGLIAVDAPPVTRLVVAVPATLAASGYLQAHLRFCAGFGTLGVFNFGPVGPMQQVEDEEARRLDRRRARQIGTGAVAVGVITGVLAAAAPLSRR
jgi:hypothetical protein